VAPVDGSALGRFLPEWHGIGVESKGPDRLLEAVQQLAGLTLPWSQLDRVLLPARVPGYRPQDLDLLAATGQVVWIGRGALGPRDGWIALYPRGAVDLERAEGRASSTEGEEDGGLAVREVLLERLGRGACFLLDLMQAVERSGIGSRRDVLESALWDLVWAGLITNDTFAPLRALSGGARGQRRGREPALAGGRWSLVSDLTAEAEPGHGDTERLLARTWRLLDRYGVVSREAVQAEGLPGGFGPAYRVLRQMEESGRVRRGYFVDGLSGAQFALPGALDRLRAARLDEIPLDGFGAEAVRVLAALDPANPYGALLPWPEPGGGGPPRRASGAWVILVAGKAVLYLGSGGRSLTSFPVSITGEGGELGPALAALRGLSGKGRKRLLIRQIDGLAALESPLRGVLMAAGFEPDYDALSPAWIGASRSADGRDPGADVRARPWR
jgi:ATP-dependent Lhr-like helicase